MLSSDLIGVDAVLEARGTDLYAVQCVGDVFVALSGGRLDHAEEVGQSLNLKRSIGTVLDARGVAGSIPGTAQETRRGTDHV
jgi:hypothetical protein